MGAVNVVVGPPCAGKTTHVREHAAPGDVTIDLDAIAQALGSPDTHTAPTAVDTAARAARAAAIDAILAGIDGTAWVIHTNPQPEQVARYVKAGAAFTVLDPGVETVTTRATEDGRPGVTRDAIAKWYAAPPQLPTPTGDHA